MCNLLRMSAVLGLVSLWHLSFPAVAGAQQESPFAAWPNSLPTDPGYFPIGVWLQNERFSEDYRAMGINLYIGLGGFRTEQEQLAWLRDHNMPVIARQSSTMLNLLAQNSPLLEPVVAWMQQDEPDNAQSLPGGGFGPPVTPEEIQNRYATFQANDPTRPVYLNLGQGVAWDGWVGRGVRTNHPEDYPEYQKGADILSFDIYPAASTRPEIAGNLWRVGYGVKRLREWTDDHKPVWNIIEASAVSGGGGKVTPHELRAEVWMSIVHGSTGIGYFVHEWDGEGNLVSTNALRSDSVLRPAVTAVNAQVRELAPVINSPTITGRHSVTLLAGDPNDSIKQNFDIDPIATMLKAQDGAYYLFTVRMRDSDATAEFALEGLPGHWIAQVLGEDRRIDVIDGVFQDSFIGWDTHLYELLLAGDANRDGRVDGQDFLFWQAGFGTQSGATWRFGDFNGDGRVDGEDFLIWQGNFGVEAGIAAVTPEPGSLLLVMAGMILLGRCRRTRPW